MTWKGCERYKFWINLSFHSGTFLLWLIKTLRNLRQDNWFLGWYFNPGPPRREAAVLTTSPWYLVDQTNWIGPCLGIWCSQAVLMDIHVFRYMMMCRFINSNCPPICMTSYSRTLEPFTPYLPVSFLDVLQALGTLQTAQIIGCL